jgi:uncharacterized membrane protein
LNGAGVGLLFVVVSGAAGGAAAGLLTGDYRAGWLVAVAIIAGIFAMLAGIMNHIGNATGMLIERIDKQTEVLGRLRDRQQRS